ncbi:membrane protein RL11T [Cercopithecine betaherpesvirus 5]|uniref:Membrane protein RL11T n=1 Tax=Simian cytomegalovirus (strain Colburn) TaxID=50292 RepID=G8XTK4_SCMVC|nr:membrane protein RL11T [Cercopithecine betaherpesvirus 5]AEV80496.1 membrane protein RL11T [Cercopithecine betaherpesvirus 5]
MHFRISYIVKDATLYIFIMILSGSAANTTSLSTSANGTSSSTLTVSTTSSIATALSTSVTPTTNSSLSSTIFTSSATDSSQSPTTIASTETTTNVSSTNSVTTNSSNVSVSISASSTTTTLTTTNATNTSLSNVSSSTVPLTTPATITSNNSKNTTNHNATNVNTTSAVVTVTPTNTTRNFTSTTRTSTTAMAGFILHLVNATVGETVTFKITNYTIHTHENTVWILMYNKSNKHTEHELCKSSSSHHIKHRWEDLCYNCNQSMLTLYNVTYNDSRRYVLRTESSSTHKPEAFDLTITAGNGTSYSNDTPAFCSLTSSTPPTSTNNQFIAVAVSSGAYAAWALALVLTVVAAMIFGQGRMRRPPYRRHREDDEQELIVRYHDSGRRRLTATGYDPVYDSP